MTAVLPEAPAVEVVSDARPAWREACAATAIAGMDVDAARLRVEWSARELLRVAEVGGGLVEGLLSDVWSAVTVLDAARKRHDASVARQADLFAAVYPGLVE